MNFSSLNNCNSPTNNQDFIWYAEYYDGTIYSEFDFESKENNSFYNIKKDKVVRFGILGLGHNMYYEVSSGIFKINGKMIEIVYKVNNKEYYLTGQQNLYDDMITYKDAESIFNIQDNNQGLITSSITQFNFGYKSNIKINDIEFIFKPLVKIPYRGNVYLNIRLISNKNLNGQLIIKKNGLIVEKIDAPLKLNKGGELNWIVG